MEVLKKIFNRLRIGVDVVSRRAQLEQFAPDSQQVLVRFGMEIVEQLLLQLDAIPIAQECAPLPALGCPAPDGSTPTIRRSSATLIGFTR